MCNCGVPTATDQKKASKVIVVKSSKSSKIIQVKKNTKKSK